MAGGLVWSAEQRRGDGKRRQRQRRRDQHGSARKRLAGTVLLSEDEGVLRRWQARTHYGEQLRMRRCSTNAPAAYAIRVERPASAP